MTLLLLTTIFVVDLQATPPILATLKYTLIEEKFMDRKVFIMKSKNNLKLKPLAEHDSKETSNFD